MRKFWIDTDAGTDDAHAILLALAQPDVEVIGFSTVYGNSTPGQSAKNVLRILKVAERLDIPVTIGVEKSLIGIAGNSVFHGKDGLGDAPDENAPDENLIKQEHGVNALLRAIREQPGELSLIMMGPVTNLAVALRIDPGIAGQIQHCYIMGGSYRAEGNITASGEYNFHCDPEAAHVVLQELRCPVTLCCWETCVKSGLTMDFYRKMANMGSRKSDFIRDITEYTIRTSFTDNPGIEDDPDSTLIPRADPVVVAVALAPEITVSSRRRSVKVALSGKEARGTMIVDWQKRHFKDSPEIDIIMEIDKDIFWQMLYDCLK